jgi:hypothetical protein
MFMLATHLAVLNTAPLKPTLFQFGTEAPFIMPVRGQTNLSSMPPNEFRQLAEDSLSALMKLRENITNEPSQIEADNATIDNETNLPMQQIKTDVSGNYRNPTYGILDFVIPTGWYGSERKWSGDKSISLDMHEGTEEEYMNQLISPMSADVVNDTIPTMLLESTDKAQLQRTQSLLGETSSMSETGTAISECINTNGSMRYLEPNSTATIDGKVYDVSSGECTYSTDLGLTVVAYKNYRYESPERIYLLHLEVYNDLYDGSKNVKILR